MREIEINKDSEEIERCRKMSPEKVEDEDGSPRVPPWAERGKYGRVQEREKRDGLWNGEEREGGGGTEGVPLSLSLSLSLSLGVCCSL